MGTSRGATAEPELVEQEQAWGRPKNVTYTVLHSSTMIQYPYAVWDLVHSTRRYDVHKMIPTVCRTACTSAWCLQAGAILRRPRHLDVRGFVQTYSVHVVFAPAPASGTLATS